MSHGQLFSLLPAEVAAIKDVHARIDALGRLLSERSSLPDQADLDAWLAHLAAVKRTLGHLSNDLSAVACVRARRELTIRHGVAPYDAAAKPQGANGLDIDVVSSDGSRIVGEVKTTTPVSPSHLGAQQRVQLRKDLRRLNAEDAGHRYLFVTDALTARLVCTSLAHELGHVEVVFLGALEPVSSALTGVS
jgi:hypothetical protein